MNRLDVYTAVHKMQRARLFRLTLQAGTADFADATVRQALASAVDAVIKELHAHADHEDRFIHPLLRERVPAVATLLDDEHEALDAVMEGLHDDALDYASGAAEPNRLYRSLASFTATYLSHLTLEETEALPALWDRCTDEELFGILMSFKGSRSEAENLTSLLAQLGTLNPAERSHMLAVGLSGATRIEVRELLATLLDPIQLGSAETLGVPV